MVSTKNLTSYCIPILAGTTASGKTALSLALVEKFPDIEIINADSLLVYRNFNIGTAKPSQEILNKIRHHLIDICNPGDPYTLGRFIRDSLAAIYDILERKKIPLIVGGTGFYLKGLLHGTWGELPIDLELRKTLEEKSNESLFQELKQRDSLATQKIHPNDRYRLIRALEVILSSGKKISSLRNDNQSLTENKNSPSFELFVIDRENADLHERIKHRVDTMIQNGLIEETEALLRRYPNAVALKSVGYLQVVRFLRNELPSGRLVRPGTEGLKDEIALATRQLVKKQRTWFKGEKEAQWFKISGSELKFGPLEFEKKITKTLFEISKKAKESNP